MSLDQFIEPIQVADEPIGDEYEAYKMDSTDKDKNMRKMVDLGTCHCCDYFLSIDSSITLIEETQLLETVNNIRDKYNYLNDKDKDDVVNNCIQEEMQLKAYGAMLVLCRLTAKYASAKELIQNKKYNFWLVASSIKSGEEKRFFDSLKDSLLGKLKGVLGGTLLEDVRVLPSEILKKELSNNVTIP